MLTTTKKLLKYLLPCNNKPLLTTSYSYPFFDSTFTPNKSPPAPNSRNILITAALPYVNNTPHLGNIIGGILSADCYARYCRLRGYNTLFISGTDQYGTTTQIKALKEKKKPEEICEQYHKEHKEVYSWFDIQFDHFSRTSIPVHTDITNQIFAGLFKNGYVKKQTIKQFHCHHCNLTLADRYVKGTCKNCNK